MSQAGIPVVPGFDGDNQSASFLLEAADHIGYPVMIKPAMGGGGKGMKICTAREHFASLLQVSQKEARGSCGDDRVVLERYISRSRHVEVQIFGDDQENMLHLYTRDCSAQRRHQKIIEEAPAPDLTDHERERIGQIAVDAGHAVKYRNAGTVEFIVDLTSNAKEFFFLEVNTRLQVEHTVTEMVTGQDLVEWQLRIAGGEQLPILLQEQVPCRGSSMEARIYAENPEQDFLPQSGTLNVVDFSGAEQLGSRIDTGVEQGDHVSVFYDPILAKVVTWGATRTIAREKLYESLNAISIRGIQTNVSYASQILQLPEFIRGGFDTSILQNMHKQNREGHRSHTKENPFRFKDWKNLIVSIARFVLDLKCRPHWLPGGWGHIACSGFETNRTGGLNISISEAGHTGPPVVVNLEKLREGQIELVSLTSGNENSVIRVMDHVIRDIGPGTEQVHMHLGVWSKDTYQNYYFMISIIEGRDFFVSDCSSSSQSAFHLRHVPLDLEEFRILDESTQMELTRKVLAPMPGKLVEIHVQNGQAVSRGDALFTLEAMKMRHLVRSPKTAMVDEVLYQRGDVVSLGATVMTLDYPNETS
eukprot:CAMPEP_0184690008 /NCGR_PEP_ID=MMETSP0312-20130426/30974_1 /TAXON_ID=31354 /ORGANISM="Compsopogon coeruleus, Strain SAG 36.94" /LENGTH=587 /DNA_ID=CAMNT_0027147425 /DNA_START=570 /DNA_END=2333 /DNA_ORIENTATION=-